MKCLTYIFILISILSCSPYDSLDKRNPSYATMSKLEKLKYNEKLYGVQINTNAVILNEGHLYDRHEEHWLLLYSTNSPTLHNIEELHDHLLTDMNAGVKHVNSYAKGKYVNNPKSYYFYPCKTNNWIFHTDYVEADNGNFLLLRKVAAN